MGPISMFAIVVAFYALLKVLYLSLSIYKTYKEVKKIGLPIVFTPISNRKPLWLFLEPYVLPFIRLLPFGLASCTKYCKRGWLYRSNFHEQFGPAFILFSPADTTLILADPDAAEYVLHHRKDFEKGEHSYKSFNLFGRNVLTTTGETWQRHRRITSPPFNERNSNLVWRESLGQAEGMVKTWLRNAQDGISSTWNDTLMLALNVLMGAGFGKPHPFERDDKSPNEKAERLYRDTLRFILDNTTITMLTYRYSLPFRFLPAKWSMINQARIDFKHQMASLVEEARKTFQDTGIEGDNLMSALLRSSESQEQNDKSRNNLADDEILGNLFIYNFAGHDTTANTLAYAVNLLAANPELQEWLRDEITFVLGSNTNAENWEYEKAFPQLKRCLALMYETLRLYGPVTGVMRNTNFIPKTLKIAGKDYQLPAGLAITSSITVLHVLPEYWGPDPLTYRPQRWIISSSSPSTPSSLASQLSQETHFQPHPGTFIPWITGPRVCPGKKFSQVEFVAAIAYLVGKYRVSPVLLEGETMEEAQKRIMAEVEQSSPQITLKMTHQQAIKFRWEKL